jgi:hypothetical protein
MSEIIWLTLIGNRGHVTTDKADARRRIDAIIERLRCGDDH